MGEVERLEQNGRQLVAYHADGRQHFAARRLPDNIDPAVRFVLEQVPQSSHYRGPRVWWRLEAGAGVGKDTIRHWKYHSHKRSPGIAQVRAALRELGYDLAIVPLEVEQ